MNAASLKVSDGSYSELHQPLILEITVLPVSTQLRPSITFLSLKPVRYVLSLLVTGCFLYGRNHNSCDDHGGINNEQETNEITDGGVTGVRSRLDGQYPHAALRIEYQCLLNGNCWPKRGDDHGFK